MHNQGTEREPIVIAISGRGRTLSNFITREKDDNSRYKIVGVISSSKSCEGNNLAYKADLPLYIGNFTAQSLLEIPADLIRWLTEVKAKWIILAGFLKPFPVKHHLEKKIINIHPALLPKYGGKGMYGNRVHQAVKQSGDSTTGATIHFVNERYDEGQLIAQAAIPVLADDSVATIARKVFQTECHLYPRVVNDLIDGKLPLSGNGILKLNINDMTSGEYNGF